MLLVAVVPTGAGADDSTVSGSWFFSEQPDPLPPPAGSPAKVPTPDVPSNDLAVAAKAAATPDQQSDKESYIHVDLSSAPDGAILSSLTITLKEDPAGGNANQSTAVIEAHPVTAFFADGTAGAPYSQRPTYDPNTKVAGTRAADGTWTFDLGSLVSGKDKSTIQGFALIPAAPPPPDPASSFEVVWAGNPAPTATFTASAPPDSSSTGNDAFSSPAAVTPSTGTGSSSSSGGFASASPAPPTNATGFLNPPPAIAPSSPAPAATPAATPAAASPVRRVARAHSKHGLPLTAIPVVLAIAVLIGLTAIALGELGEPQPPRQGSVLRRLERPAETAA